MLKIVITKIQEYYTHESRGTCSVNSQIKFKTTMLKYILCDYSDGYILVKGTITVNNTAAADADENNINKKVIFVSHLLIANNILCPIY